MIAWFLPAWGTWFIGVAAALLVLALLARTGPGHAALNRSLAWFVRSLLWFRYRVRVTGLQEVAQRGKTGILFLQNHPALIDPVIVFAHLLGTFRQRALADEDQIDRFFIRWLCKRINVLPIPDPAKIGAAGRDRIEAALDEIIESLRRGGNVQLSPAGRLCRSRLESLRGASATEQILQALPDVRVVLVRTRGLWGSSFSWASGHEPKVGPLLGKTVKSLLAGLLFFMPRREVTVELHELDDLPRTAGRAELNRFIEDFYNADAPPNTYVPYTWWERGAVRQRPEPVEQHFAGDPSHVPATTRRIVTEYLQKATGLLNLRDDQLLAVDLGLDSLGVADVTVWLESEFGFPQGNVESLRTVGDVMLAACGESISAEAGELRPVGRKWFDEIPGNPRVRIPEGETITELFLKHAERSPGRIVAADQTRGAVSYRDVITAVYVLKPIIEALPGERVGIMLPASVGADILLLSTLFAGKTPVMVNWTAGVRNAKHSLNLVDCQQVLTARALVWRLATQGIDMRDLSDRLVFLEDVGKEISLWTKIKAALKAQFSWAPLRRAPVSATAVILFTSGSESLPKAVPLTHRNLLANVRDIASVTRLYRNDRLLGMLPPFHSGGLMTGIVLPLCLGLKVVHHPNPTEGRMLAQVIEAYRVTILPGTPTFAGGIVRASTSEQLATLRLGVTGAEKCTQRVYQALAQRCPKMIILEAYGLTECSAIISLGDENDPRPGTIGKTLPSVEHVVLDLDTGGRARPGRHGMLLARGPSVFEGYLHYDGEPPFVTFEGKQWYRTSDLVSEDADGVLTFRGRLKRFVKLGGEMISLPAVEAVLQQRCVSEADEGPVLVVEATPNEEHPELVLFTTRDLDRQTVNRWIREGGLSALHNVTRVVHVPQIPVLGTGKTDYRVLREMLTADIHAPRTNPDNGVS